MNFKLEQAIREMQSVLDMWEFMARRTPYNDEEGLESWTENDAKAHYGTWVDDEGEEQVCQSAAEQTCAKLIKAAEELAKDWENSEREWRMRRDSAQRRIEELEKFAGMSDRDLGDFFTKHLERAKEDEGEETLLYIPDFYWHIARRLSK